MLTLIFYRIREFVRWVARGFREPQYDELPTEQYDELPDALDVETPVEQVFDNVKQQSKLAVKRLKQKQLFARITKAKYIEIRAKFTDKPMPTDLMLNRPIDEEDELFEKPPLCMLSTDDFCDIFSCIRSI
jgi:hypothetical protein